jgi:hypothetical protein
MMSPRGKKLTRRWPLPGPEDGCYDFSVWWWGFELFRLFSDVWRDTQASSPITIQSRKSAGFRIDTAILNTHCEHNVAVTVAGELCSATRFLSHTSALPFLKKKIPLHFYWTCIPPNIRTTTNILIGKHDASPK